MAVSHSQSYEDGRKPEVNRALCLIDHEALCELNETLELLGWRLDHVETIQQAVNALQFDQYEAIIACVSTSKASLFDEYAVDESSRRLSYKSFFLDHAMCGSSSTFRIIYGYEAAELDDVRQACFDCGADAVVNSSAGLFDILFGLVTKPLPTNDSRVLDAETKRFLSQISGGVTTRRMRPLEPQLSMRFSTNSTEILPLSLGSNLDMSMNPTELAPFDITLSTNQESVPSLMFDESCRLRDYSIYKTDVFQATGTGPCLRVVHVSDTLGLHRHLNLPDGDIFMHGGNFTDGKQSTWLQQFEGFLEWIRDEVLTAFRQVVFIAGSQDMFLDTIACKYNSASREAQRILNRFLSANSAVAFLENTSITFRGLVIHGSSMTILKANENNNEVEVKHEAFERDFDTFVRSEINDECDILLTHRPPSFLFHQPNYVLLTDRLYTPQPMEPEGGGSKRRLPFRFRRDHSNSDVKVKRKHAPRVHAFGHYGKDFGVETDAGTLLLNGSQEHVLGDNKDDGGIALVVDIPTYR